MKIILPFLLLLSWGIAHAQFNANYAIKLPYGGYSTAISSDGSTIITGAPGYYSGVGAAIIYRQVNGECPYMEAVLEPGDNIHGARFGRSVAISADGNTAVIGGDSDDVGIGAVWVYQRTNGKWTEQKKIVAADAFGNARQGYSVALSGDGNTLVFGGPYDNTETSYPYSSMGAFWIYNFSDGAWKQNGSKRVAPGNYGYGYQGWSLAISRDGTTIITGEPKYSYGYTHIWTLQNGTWNYTTSFYSSDYHYQNMGWSVSLSADGSEALVGAPGSSNQGAALIAIRQSATGTWSYSGQVLQGAGGAGNEVEKGFSVSLSGDGETAVIGDYAGNTTGATWLFGSNGGSQWNELGNSPLTGLNARGNSQQGYCVALSGDGKTLVSGGPSDNSGHGALWLFPYQELTTTAPVINSISPQSGPAHTKVTIKGSHLRGTMNVLFGGTPADSFNWLDDSILEAWVGDAGSGKVQVITACADASFDGFTLTNGGSSIATINEATRISIYPNPVNDKLTVDFATTPIEPVTIMLTDAYGREMTRHFFSGGTVFEQDVQALAPGLYFLTVRSMSGSSHSSKIIKQ